MLKKSSLIVLSLAVILSVSISACAPAAEAPAAEAPAAEAPAAEAPAAEAPVEKVESEFAAALEDGKLVIAWLPKSLNNPVFEIGHAGAEKKAAELTAKGPYTVEIIYAAPVAADSAEQVQVMEDVISQGAEAIAVSCNLADPCIEPINKAVDAGIPVMTWDADSPSSKRFTYLGVDNYEGGKLAGELMKEFLPDGGDVALLGGVPGSANIEERLNGFKDAIKGSNINVVDTVFANDDVPTGVNVVEEITQKYPDLDGWFFSAAANLFASEGSMPLWEAKAKDMVVVSFDTIPQFLTWVKGGYIKVEIGQKYYGWGYDAVQMIYDKMVDGKTFESFTNSGMDIVSIKNVDAMQNMWDVSDFTLTLPSYK